MFQMSLTVLIRRVREARVAFKRNMAAPPRERRPKIVLTPSSAWPLIAGDVGRAYDYWIRFVCISLNRLGTGCFREFLGYRHFVASNYNCLKRFHGAMDQCLRSLDDCYGKELYLEPSLLKSLIILGYFERDYRDGDPLSLPDLAVPDASVKELKVLAMASETLWLRGAVDLNPEFGLRGKKGRLLGDGDLIVDGVLYEIKASRELRPLETLRQLLGYAVMRSLDPSRPQFHSVGFYYVRFQYRYTIPLSSLVTPEQFERLRQFVLRKIGPLSV